MRDPSMHVRDEDLLLAAENELPVWRGVWVRRHLGRCSLCRGRAARLDTTLLEFVRFHDKAANTRGQSSPVLRNRILDRLANDPGPASGEPQRRRWSAALAQQLASASVAFAIVAVAAWTLLGPTAQHAIDQLSWSRNTALPLRVLTPGATRPVSLSTVCRSRDSDAPPPVDASVEQRVFGEYGVPISARNHYELDYLITPQLGGADDIRNLWPEPYASTDWNAHVKDELESLLHEKVCHGEISLSAAQNEIATDWIAAYKKRFHTDRPLEAAPTLTTSVSKRPKVTRFILPEDRPGA